MTKESSAEIISLKGGFWKYFWRVIKSAKWLFIRGIAISLMWLVTAVFANTMKVADLTYYNALITIYFFFDIFYFGVTQGVMVLLESKKKDKENYLRAGFYVNAATNFVGAVILFAGGEWILSSLLGLTNVDSMLFYYLMCGVIIFSSVTKYFESTLRLFNKTKQQMNSNIIIFVTIIFGFALLFLVGGVVLTWIPLIFFVAFLLSAIYNARVFRKEFGVNILKLKKVSLSKNEFLIIFTRLLVEIFWQVGYTLASLFLLKYSESIFNTYSYFENVLDVLLNFLYASLHITSLQVARLIGRRRYQGAYIVGKYSVLIALSFWVGYAVLSGILFWPFMMGLNPELLQTGAQTYFLYIGLYLFRVLAWTLSSYVLTAGGKSLAQTIMQVLVTIYYLTFYLLANFIPFNIFIAYGVMAFESLVILTTDVIMFCRKNWTGKGEIVAIVFDFDDTLYQGADWTNWEKYCLHAARKLTGKNLRNIGSGEQVVQALVKHGLDPDLWREYREKNPFPIKNPQEIQVIKNNDLRKLSKRYSLFIATNSTIPEVYDVCKQLKINPKWFKGIYSNRYEKDDLTKFTTYKQIAKEADLYPYEMMVVGNSFDCDILPAQNFGANTLLAENALPTYKNVRRAIKFAESKQK